MKSKTRKPIGFEEKHMGFVVEADVKVKRKDKVKGEVVEQLVRRPVSGRFAMRESAEQYAAMYERQFGVTAFPVEKIVKRNIYAA